MPRQTRKDRRVRFIILFPEVETAKKIIRETIAKRHFSKVSCKISNLNHFALISWKNGGSIF